MYICYTTVVNCDFQKKKNALCPSHLMIHSVTHICAHEAHPHKLGQDLCGVCVLREIFPVIWFSILSG